MAIMRKSRTDLQKLLETVLGSKNVYYRPPESIKMKYPAIVYDMITVDSRFANNTNYLVNARYTITLIEKEADSKYLDKLLELPYCKHTSHYKSEGLEHNRFELVW